MKPELEASGGAESSLGFILFLEGGFDTYIIFIPHSSEYSLSHTHTILKCLYARKLSTGLSNFTLKNIFAEHFFEKFFEKYSTFQIKN